ncbi:hypothetical protein NWP17_06895 [Chrysosporum bergii ANA360D]|uniref:Uncharacterized protein n=1 Tax=Chrysosporum bergii ANA360D TaxID=617107 RepID=A0AA43KB82_9CYAN|nr:hypothetical protein [Chrysosporum bergii]MDH6060164.1 hypothetical protein [Chrysosporum bergii ANA360D]
MSVSQIGELIKSSCYIYHSPEKLTIIISLQETKKNPLTGVNQSGVLVIRVHLPIQSSFFPYHRPERFLIKFHSPLGKKNPLTGVNQSGELVIRVHLPIPSSFLTYHFPERFGLILIDRNINGEQSYWLQTWGLAVGDFNRLPHSSTSSLALILLIFASSLIFYHALGIKTMVLVV